MSLVYGPLENSIRNRKHFLEQFGIDYRDLVSCHQAHGANVKAAEESDRGRGSIITDNLIANTDALITNKRQLPLAMFTADCLSVFLFDAKNEAIGIAHAGWKGTREQITAKAVLAMVEKFKTDTMLLEVGFGPCLRECCYEVGKEFNDYFDSGLIKKKEKLYLDLIAINKKQLLSLGVKEKNISDSKICTSCDNDEYFSYRKEGIACGRMISVIMLK